MRTPSATSTTIQLGVFTIAAADMGLPAAVVSRLSVASVPILSAFSVGAGLVLAGVAVVVVAVARRFGWVSDPSTGAESHESDVDSDAASGVDSASDATGLDPEEAFVVDLLRSEGGRIQQTTIVEASDWSKSKVSRLLSRMERDGLVEKVSVGRENVVLLALDDP